ncbi:hypothetical protein ACIQZB_43785 [Streptomyces sp. NPDC097727]|uniref:hypothetical protein n=1 Tax=Streptomyces sp. NPDC097727 TaxID=3366092 RepID=UPI00382D991D
MKISTVYRVTLVAACALAALSPSQAFAAQSPGCPKKNIAYLNAQDNQEDAGAKVLAAQQALNKARNDRDRLDRIVDTGDQLKDVFYSVRPYVTDYTDDDVKRIEPLGGAADKVVMASDDSPRALGAAAAKEADLAQKAVDGLSDQAKKSNPELQPTAQELIKRLREDAEAARKMDSFPAIDARQAELDTAVKEKTDADNAVRPARDAYRDCLAKANG